MTGVISLVVLSLLIPGLIALVLIRGVSWLSANSSRWAAGEERSRAKDNARRNLGGPAYRFFVTLQKVLFGVTVWANFIYNTARLYGGHVDYGLYRLLIAIIALFGLLTLISIAIVVTNIVIDRRIAARGGAEAVIRN